MRSRNNNSEKYSIHDAWLSLNSFVHNGQAFKSLDYIRSKVYLTILANGRQVYLQFDYKLIRPVLSDICIYYSATNSTPLGPPLGFTDMHCLHDWHVKANLFTSHTLQIICQACKSPNQWCGGVLRSWLSRVRCAPWNIPVLVNIHIFSDRER